MNKQSNVPFGTPKKPSSAPIGRPQDKASKSPPPFSMVPDKETFDINKVDISKMTTSDVRKMIDRIRELHDEIEVKLDFIYQKSG